MNKVKGGTMMVFLGAENKSIAFATNHTLSISGDLSDTSNKDEGAGDWGSQEVNLLNWTASSENLYSLDGEGDNFADLYDIMIEKEPVKLVLCRKSSNATTVPSGGWDPEAAGSNTPRYEGMAIISSLDLQMPNGDYATYSVQFQGVGALQKKTS